MVKSLFIYCENNLFGFWDFTKVKLIEAKYQEVKEFIGDLTWVKKDNKWYLIDVNEKIKTNKYDELLHFDAEISIVRSKNVAYIIGHMDFKSKKIPFDFVKYNNNIFLVKNKKEYFFLSKNLKEISKDKYENAKEFNDGFAPVFKNGSWGVINSDGRIIIDFKYQEIFIFSSYLFHVKQNNKDFFIDIKENKYLENTKNNLIFNDNFIENYIPIWYKNKCGLMDEFFEIQFFKKIDKIIDGFDKYFIFIVNGKYGVLTNIGKTIISPIYDKIFYKTDDYFYVKKNNEYNYYSLSKKKLVF